MARGTTAHILPGSADFEKAVGHKGGLSLQLGDKIPLTAEISVMSRFPARAVKRLDPREVEE
jgi:hypothetical protein